MSLKDDILTADDLATRPVKVPEWRTKANGNKPLTIHLRTLTGTERDAFEESFADKKTGKSNYANFRARLLVRCIVDPDTGELVFTERDVVKLGKKSAAAINRLFSVAQEMNGITDRSVDEAAEDFDDAPSGSSTSG